MWNGLSGAVRDFSYVAVDRSFMECCLLDRGVSGDRDPGGVITITSVSSESP